jgi:hypothetical protein
MTGELQIATDVRKAACFDDTCRKMSHRHSFSTIPFAQDMRLSYRHRDKAVRRRGVERGSECSAHVGRLKFRAIHYCVRARNDHVRVTSHPTPLQLNQR